VSDYELRRATPGDAEAIARTMELGFDGYRAFAPESWIPPEVSADSIRTRLEDDAVWCQVGLADGEMAGHVSFMPASLHGTWPDEGNPHLAHFWQLFVREPHWGTGLARDLHANALEAADERGFETMRLFAAEPQSRARAFYESQGWRQSGEPFLEESFGMPLVQYRISLPRRTR
jgi:GNAT superfamily N-acetyltransferase